MQKSVGKKKKTETFFFLNLSLFYKTKSYILKDRYNVK